MMQASTEGTSSPDTDDTQPHMVSSSVTLSRKAVFALVSGIVILLILAVLAIVLLLRSPAKSNQQSAQPSGSGSQQAAAITTVENKDGSPLQTVSATLPGLKVELNKIVRTDNSVSVNYTLRADPGVSTVFYVATDKRPCTYSGCLYLDLAGSYLLDDKTNQRFNPLKDENGNVLATKLPSQPAPSYATQLTAGHSLGFSVKYTPPAKGSTVSIALPFAQSFDGIVL